jgi:hypothetical protein
MVIGTPCSGPSARLDGLVRRLGPLARTLDVGGDDGVEFGIIGLDPLQIEVEQFEAADLLLSDRCCELLGGLEGQGKRHGRVSVPAMDASIARTILCRPP